MSFLSRLGISRGKSSSSLRSRSSSSSSQASGVTAVPQGLPLATEFARVDGDEEDLYNVQIPRGVGAGGSFWLDVNGGKRVKIRVPQGEGERKKNTFFLLLLSLVVRSSFAHTRKPVNL